jgi:hypothetical protein
MVIDVDHSRIDFQAVAENGTIVDRGLIKPLDL